MKDSKKGFGKPSLEAENESLVFNEDNGESTLSKSDAVVEDSLDFVAFGELEPRFAVKSLSEEEGDNASSVASEDDEATKDKLKKLEEDNQHWKAKYATLKRKLNAVNTEAIVSKHSSPKAVTPVVVEKAQSTKHKATNDGKDETETALPTSKADKKRQKLMHVKSSLKKK
jgi:hypothetical protein